MQKIMVVEDDPEINRLLCDFLTMQHYKPVSAQNGMDALTIARAQPDIALVLLDMMLPFRSGDRVLQKLREFSSVPVIIVSAKDTVRTKIEVLRLGADDYITKPFDLDEILVRIEAVLRRCGIAAPATINQPTLTYKDITLDTAAKTVTVGGTLLVLTGKEYAILELLLRHPTKLFSKANLFESVWNEPYFSDDNTIKVHMSNLRSKLKDCAPTEEYIETVWGMGYRLKA